MIGILTPPPAAGKLLLPDRQLFSSVANVILNASGVRETVAEAVKLAWPGFDSSSTNFLSVSSTNSFATDRLALAGLESFSTLGFGVLDVLTGAIANALDHSMVQAITAVREVTLLSMAQGIADWGAWLPPIEQRHKNVLARGKGWEEDARALLLSDYTHQNIQGERWWNGEEQSVNAKLLKHYQQNVGRPLGEVWAEQNREALLRALDDWFNLLTIEEAGRTNLSAYVRARLREYIELTLLGRTLRAKGGRPVGSTEVFKDKEHVLEVCREAYHAVAERENPTQEAVAEWLSRKGLLYSTRRRATGADPLSAFKAQRQRWGFPTWEDLKRELEK